MKSKKEWSSFVAKLNSNGIPFPTLRDPASGKGSVSLTLMFIAFNMWLFAIIGKVSGLVGGIDTRSTFEMFLATSALYWSRKLTKSGDGFTIEEKVEDNDVQTKK